MNFKPLSKTTLYLFFAALLLAITGCNTEPFYIRVASIEGVPETGEAGTPLVLTGTVRPSFASSKDIAWSVKDAGTTRTVISGNVLNAEAGGTVTIKATIANGMSEGSDYTQDFDIVIDAILTVYTVTFESNGGNTPASQSVKEGKYATRPRDPEKQGFGFDNWYSDAGLTRIYDFNTPVTGDIVLYAKWMGLISNIAIEVTGPGTGEAPDTAATISTSASGAQSGANYTLGNVAWSPYDNPFKGSTRYSATVTVTAKSGSKFTEPLTAEINGYHNTVITGKTDTSVKVSYTFAQTLAKKVKEISIESQPATLTWTHGDPLDLSGLSVKLTFDDDTTEIVASADFESMTISTDPADGDKLSYTAHNNQPVTVSIGRNSAYTYNLTVSKAKPDISFPTADPIVYGDPLSKSELKGGSTQYGSFAWQDKTIVPDKTGTHKYPVVFTAYDTDNYDYSEVDGWDSVTGTAVQNVQIKVDQALGAPVGTPTIDTVDASSLSITVKTVAQPGNGQTVEYAISTTPAAPESGWQDGTKFSGLSTDITYYIFARSKEDDNYSAGKASVSAPIAFYTVTFKIEDGSTRLVQNVLSGGKATAPTPSGNVYAYDGWYREAAYLNKWDFNSDTVTASITLYAKRLFRYTLELTFEDIEQAPELSIPTISRTGANKTTTVSVDNPDQYDSITWVIPTYGINKTSQSITLDSKDFMFGKHYITLEVIKDGKPYSRTIAFEVVK